MSVMVVVVVAVVTAGVNTANFLKGNKSPIIIGPDRQASVDKDPEVVNPYTSNE